VAAIGRGGDHAALAGKLGADVYIDSAKTDAAVELQKLGGAQAILANCHQRKGDVIADSGLGPNGSLIVVGVPADPLEVPALALIFGKKRIQGWASGIRTDSEDTLRFAEMTGVRPMIEKYPLAKAGEAYAG
jgi:D-arabinose 1-dehydrogenase-like Zn-dependent alcohol dehydrogenase